MTGNARSSGYERADNDWYVEDDHSVAVFLREYPTLLQAGLHDPCCGMGTIPRVARSLGIKATGADLIDRADGRYPVQDFLTDEAIYPNIVTNPPYSDAAWFAERAMKRVRPGGIVAVIVQEKFLFSQRRRPLFTMPECERALMLSKRPSMPPGKMLLERGESCRKGGAVNYAWVVWRVGKAAPGASIGWLL